MATIKAYTDIEQSKKLAEFLPLESADLYYDIDFDKDYHIKMPTNGYFGNKSFFIEFPEKVPCWSLAALLSVLSYPYLMQPLDDRWLIGTWYKNYPFSVSGVDNPVDACVEMIIKLHKLNLL